LFIVAVCIGEAFCLVAFEMEKLVGSSGLKVQRCLYCSCVAVHVLFV
jgi:hypothetical protein